MKKGLQNSVSEKQLIYLGNQIKNLRLENEMTQLDLAIKIDIDPTALRRYEKGQVEMGVNTLIKFAKTFKVTFDRLLISK